MALLTMKSEEKTVALPSKSRVSPRAHADWVTLGPVPPFTQIPDWPGLANQESIVTNLCN